MNNLFALRTSHQYSQSYVAKKLKVANNTYSQYENGKRQIPDELKIALCDLYQVTLDFLMGRNNTTVTDHTEFAPNTGKNLVTSIGRGGNRVTYEISDENAAIVDALLEQLGTKN